MSGFKISSLFVLLFLIVASNVAWSIGKRSGDDYLFIDFGTQNLNKRWTRVNRKQIHNVKMILQIIAKSPTGRWLLKVAEEKANKENKRLIDVLAPGSSSLTDTTLIRRFSISSPGEIEYEQHSKVFINRDLSVIEAVLDLSHELTHYTFRKPFNPYHDKFSLQAFIKSTLEEKGGEVDAYIMECKVLFELYPKKVQKKFQCHQIMNEDGVFSRALAIRQFYRIGNHYGQFKSKLKEMGIQSDFPYLSRNEAIFISSAYGVPYPVAAFHEFKQVRERACENDKNRLVLLRKTAGRSPASSSSDNMNSRIYQSFLKSFFERCQS